jgi:transcriptional regulator with XRE-family HTH domain
MDTRVILGKNVRRFRKRLSVSQEELSFRTGFTRSYLSDLENGRSNPTIQSLERLAEELNVSLIDLLTPEVRNRTTKRQKQTP